MDARGLRRNVDKLMLKASPPAEETNNGGRRAQEEAFKRLLIDCSCFNSSIVVIDAFSFVSRGIPSKSSGIR